MAFSAETRPALNGYSGAQIILHWLIALLIFAQLVFGESMTAFVEAAEEGETVSGLGANLASMHYYFGLSILGLVLVRLALRITTGVPPQPETNGVLDLVAKLTHWLFYVLLIIVPITGLLGYYIGDPYGEVHTLAKPVFIALISLHVAAALYHQFWRKDGLLMRMVRPR